jgi:VIT1/CCC1 family predicted Fe2+/Mn2+ transporter
MLIGALGCNLAWGIIDGVLYLMGCLADSDRKLTMLRAVRKATDSQKAQRLIAGALPPTVASVLRPEELDSIWERLNRLPEPHSRARLSNRDWIGALGVFLLVFLSTLPVAVPFMFINNARLALRVSNGVAITMLFIAGLAYGRCISRSPKLIGAGMVFLGVVLVSLTIVLGG